MKKIYNILLLLVGVCILTACDDDRDSNPTLKEPTEFILNTPAYAEHGIYDLKNTETVELTCSQPDYGYTAPVTYSVEISLTDNFDGEDAETSILPTTYSSAKMEVISSELAIALSALLGVDEENYPTDPYPVFIRTKASLEGAKAMTSNSIKLPNVLGYFALDAMVMPAEMHLIGSINGWEWANAYSMTPVHSADGKFWRVVYFDANSEIKFNTQKDWVNAIGYEQAQFDQSSIDLAGLSGLDGGNIKVSNAGWYIVVVTTTIEGRSYQFDIEFLQPKVYLTGDPSGGYDVFDDARLFTVPADGTGEFVSPTTVASGELRMCIKLTDIDWWKTEFVILNGKIEYRGKGDDQERVNISVGQKANLNFTQGTGSIN